MTAADHLLDVLEAAGVDTFFGLPGSTEAPLLEAMRDRDMRYLLALHEGVAVAMADGYARLAGRPGIVGLHTSVGTLNGLSQMMNALRDGSPLVVTSGHKDRAVLSEEGFCALPDLLAAARAVSKWAHQSLSADAVATDIAHALRVAMAPPQGPTYLAVPEDLLGGETSGTADAAIKVATAPGVAAVASAESVRAAVDRLVAAERPVLVVGSAARHAWPEVKALSQTCGMAVLLADRTDLGDVPVPTGDPSYLGTYGEDPLPLAGCDLVIAAGCRVFYPFSDAKRPRLPEGAALIHLHDDPVEVGRLVRADVGLLGDVRAGLAAMVAELSRRDLDEDGRARRAARVADMAARRRAQRQAERQAAAGAAPLRVEEVADVLSGVLPDQAVIVDEAVRSSPPLLRHLPLGPGQRWLRTSGGALGWGTPAAIGASLAAPDRPVVALIGDGSFQFSVQALWSAVQASAPVTVLVLDNGGYLAVRRAIEGYLGVDHDPRKQPGTDIGGIDCTDIARGYGVASRSVRDAESLGKALAEGVASDRPTVLQVPVAEVAP